MWGWNAFLGGRVERFSSALKCILNFLWLVDLFPGMSFYYFLTFLSFASPIRFLGYATFLQSFPVRVKNIGIHSIEFFKQKKGKKGNKETLCTLSTSPLQVFLYNRFCAIECAALA